MNEEEEEDEVDEQRKGKGGGREEEKEAYQKLTTRDGWQQRLTGCVWGRGLTNTRPKPVR